MGEPSNLSRDRGLPFEWWHVVAAGTAAWALFLFTTDAEWLLGPVLFDAITTLALLAWPAIPVAAYLDLRGFRDVAAWEPATKSWLLVTAIPVANVPAGVAYCARRRCAVRGTFPSPRWRFGVYAGIVAWSVVLAAGAPVGDADLGALDPVVTALLFVAWLGFPVALYLDAVRCDAYPDTSLRIRAMVVLSAVPALNVLFGVVHVGSEWWLRRERDPDVTPTLPGEPDAGGGAPTRPEPVSPWYRRASGVFVVYFLLLVVGGAWLSPGSRLAWDALALAAWLPFGIVFTACVHLDLRDVRRAGVPWGRSRYLYYTSAVFSGPAFWYLLKRFTKVGRARSNGLIEEDGGDNDGDGGDGSGTAGDERAGSGSGSTTAPGGTTGRDGSVVEDDAGFQWGGGSRG